MKIVIGLVVVDFLFLGFRSTRLVNAAVCYKKRFRYLILHGWLRAFDLVAGLALVAYHEEIVFRRVAREALQAWWAMTG